MNHPSDFDRIMSGSMSCNIICQYDEKKEGLLYELDLIADSDHTSLNNFYNLCLKMNPIQRQFFAEPTSIIDPDKKPVKYHFVYCPGNYLYNFFPKDDEPNKINNYETLNSKDKLLIMKWIFAISCSLKILIENSIQPLYLTDKSIFIDSNMDARYLYNYWKPLNKQKDSKKSASASTLPIHHYFFPPEYIEKEPPNSLYKEKSCSYSLGILILSLLVQQLPNTFFPKATCEKINEEIKKGDIFLNKIPNCPTFKPLLKDLIVSTPEKRKNIIEVIEYLLKDKNFLKESDLQEFHNYIKDKFNVRGKVDDSQLLEIIRKNLNEIVDQNTQPKVQNEILNVSDLAKPLKLVSGTSYEFRLNRIYNQIQDQLLKKLSDEMRRFYNNNKTEKNKYDLMDFCLKHPDDDSINLIKNLSLFYVEHMANNLSFYINVHQIEQKIRLAIPTDINISSDYLEKFNTNKLFVQVYDDLNGQKEIDFYPYLNVYNFLYHMSSKNPIDDTQKVKWLHQTSLALSDLHDQKYTMTDFNSQTVYIDLKLNAHLFPLKIFNVDIENKIILPLKLNEKSDYEISYYPPEMTQNLNGRFSYTEKSLVYSFGVFMLELLYGFRPGTFLENFTYSEKVGALRRTIKVPGEYFQINSPLDNLAKSCLNFDVSQRKSFHEIAAELDSYLNSLKGKELNETVEKSSEKVESCLFQLADLEEAFKNGATITYKIFDHLYEWLDLDGKFYFQLYMSSHPISYTKFDILWKLINGKDIKLSEFRNFNRNYHTQNNMISSEKVEKNDRKQQEEKSNKGLSQIAADFIQKSSESMKKVRNKPHLKYLHLNGLTINNARQLLVRYGMNQNYSYRQKVEFVVKNKDQLPYGSSIKMTTVTAIVNDYIKQGFYKNIPSFSSNPNGNSVLDLEIPFDD